MIFCFREREKVLDIFELISGLRMNMAYIRPGGVQQDYLLVLSQRFAQQ
jgi:NADH-quinone oxidoreductase subunit D